MAVVFVRAHKRKGAKLVKGYWRFSPAKDKQKARYHRLDKWLVEHKVAYKK